jgi:hypothetical protein
MISCPNCRNAMNLQSAEANAPLRPVEIGTCSTCCLLWFDQAGSIGLTPRAVLGLFQFFGTAASVARTPLASTFQCPRCADPLALTHDLQRNTRFTYWRCSRDRGQLITFDQFLREKNFVRSPTPEELARLRDTIRQVACSQCGAPVDLATDSVCPHCGAAVSLVDPEGVARALHDLQSGMQAISPAAQEATRSTLSDAQLNAIFEAARMNQRGGGDDLLAIGLGAVGAALIGLLSSR